MDDEEKDHDRYVDEYVEDITKHPERYQRVQKPWRFFLVHPQALNVLDVKYQDGKRILRYKRGRLTVTAITPEEDQIDYAAIARRRERG